ncbi:MAG: serine acetyltransferase [Deltaproteobacteria bacterium]|nr:serine acetyltransferase [Deltaproteobacteria bacterium]MBW1913649.1 serine acetyltransferase [Deltaproteobacteria bacterium]
MSDKDRSYETRCKADVDLIKNYRRHLPEIAELIIDSSSDPKTYTHIDYDPIPSNSSVIDIIDRFKEVLFPGYFAREKLDPANLKYNMGRSVSVLFDMLSEQITNSIRHDCLRYGKSCSDCGDRGYSASLDVLRSVPELRRILATDVAAVYEGDPAAKSHDEIIFSYPGIFAITVYRIAHKLFEHEVPLLPRVMTEYAHSVTGIDIHPGAEIGEHFVIDHGTGIVIGETSQIGESVRIYQGVTIGALSLPKDGGDKFRGKKRHPTIEDDVIVYSGATILGGETVIGARSVIGGNVWVTKSIPPDTTVMLEEPTLIYK